MLKNSVKWAFWIDQILDRRVTPIIGDAVTREFLFPDRNIVELWASELGYPFHDKNDLSHIAHFYSILEGEPLAAKLAYLRHLSTLIQQSANPEVARGQLTSRVSRSPRDGRTVSEIAKILGKAKFFQEPDNPLFILANLPFTIYLTTSYHTLLEQALSLVGKRPVSDHYRWYFDRDDVDLPPPSISEQVAYSHKPSEEEPLVYHLHGIDSVPESLVLTEEDHLSFFEQVSVDLKTQNGLPNPVRNALNKNSILMLGYDLGRWPFRVIFRGPIKALFKMNRPGSLAIQMESHNFDNPDSEKFIINYVKNYFDTFKFDTYWGTTAQFTSELWLNWEAG